MGMVLTSAQVLHVLCKLQSGNKQDNGLNITSDDETLCGIIYHKAFQKDVENG